MNFDNIINDDSEECIDNTFVMRLHNDLNRLSESASMTELGENFIPIHIVDNIDNIDNIDHCVNDTGNFILTNNLDFYQEYDNYYDNDNAGNSPLSLSDNEDSLDNSSSSASHSKYKSRSYYHISNGPGAGSGSGSGAFNDSFLSETNNYHHPRGSRDINIENRERPSTMHLTHDDVETSLGKYYDDVSMKRLNELDILITYLKGQKHLFIQSKTILQNRLNMLLVPCIVISSAITIFAPFVESYYWSGDIISGLNAIIVLLITLSNYLKLESSVQTFHITANQYDKLETSLEFVSSKMMFVEDTKQRSQIVLGKIQEMEKKIGEIKDWNPLFIPDEVRKYFPIVCHINIFSFIKRIEIQKQNLIANLKDVKNEIRSILLYMETRIQKNELSKNIYVGMDLSNNSVNTTTNTPTMKLGRLKQRLQFLYGVKERIKVDLSHNRNAYTHIDELFMKEIWCAQTRGSNIITWIWDFCFYNHPGVVVNSSNPVIEDYLRLTFG